MKLSSLIEVCARRDNGCLEYGRGRSRRRIHFNGDYVYAYRLTFFLKHGYWPFIARHTCDNPKCINPNHIKDGTVFDNIQDMVKRGRHAHGETTYAKLTEKQVMELRRDYTPQLGLKYFARKFGVSWATCQLAMTGKRWKHLPGFRQIGQLKGENSSKSVLTDSVVRKIRALWDSGFSKSVIARAVSANWWTVNDVILGKTWTHVT